MNGLPATIDLSALTGAVISQVCLSQFQCILNFESDARIAIESNCMYTSSSGRALPIVSHAAAATEICELIGTPVREARRQPDGGLLLRLTNEATLEILNDDRDHESFQVHLGKEVYVA